MRRKIAIIGSSPGIAAAFILRGLGDVEIVAAAPRMMRLQAAAGADDMPAMPAMSQNQVRDLLERALCEALGEDKYCWIVDIFPDRLVYEQAEHYFERTYEMADDGKVTLGDAKEVQRTVNYIPLQAASTVLHAAGSPGDAEYGYQWRVQVVEYGMGKDGRINWPREPLVAAISLYDGARVFALTDSQHQASAKPFGKSVKEIVGWLKNPVDTGAGIEADFFILKSAKWLRDNLVDSFERGAPNLLGLSHDVTARAVTKMAAGKRYKEPVEITGVEVDVVYDPTNNGKFIRMAAATGREEEDDMKWFERMMAALKGKRPELHARLTAAIAAGSMTEDQALEEIAAATVQETGGDRDNESLVAATLAGIREMFGGEVGREARLVACGATLDRLLASSKLPPKALAALRGRFEKREFEETELQAAIQQQKEILDEATGSGGIQFSGDARVVRDTTDKLQAACDRMFGVQVGDELRDITPFTSLRAAYVEMTGDTDVRGFADQATIRRLHAAGFDSSTWAYVLGNSLYRALARDYREIPDYGVSRLVGPNIRNARDFRSLETVRIAYFGDLPDVNPEVEDYADLGTLSDEKIDYTLNQKGGIVTITRKMIINDDLRAVEKIKQRLPRAARRTLAKRVWNLFISNATYKGDNKAIFHADHGNLGSAAYAITSARAAVTAMFDQTEPGSAEKLGLVPVTVAYPSALAGLVKNVNDFAPQAVAVENGNSMFGFFRPEGLVQCPFMTDLTDWMMFADPNEVDIVELAFLNGQQEPEMFVADNPNFGQFFVGDRIQYKIRHEYEAEVSDYRGAYKAVVA